MIKASQSSALSTSKQHTAAGPGPQGAAGALVVLGAVLLAAALLGAAPAVAQAPDGHCEPAAFTDKIEVARVAKARPKLNFIRGAQERKDCPSLAPQCRSSAFLVGGDTVLVSRRRGDLACASYTDAKGHNTAGWLPAATLEAVAPAEIPVPAGWTGTWKRIEAEIRIKPRLDGEIVVEGTAAWGSHDPDRVKRGTVRSGEISSKVKPAGDAIFFSDAPVDSFEKAPASECAVRMRRVGPYLLVEDNSACGGVNVSFSGLYIRR